ncbi:MAG TPA: hypothetical protein VMU04_00575 [Candidatus Acidoferrum sp.]|nr:hypothetical protein [Candidatus Acidoferrum sp.]
MEALLFGFVAALIIFGWTWNREPTLPLHRPDAPKGEPMKQSPPAAPKPGTK